MAQRILIIDDDLFIRELYTEILKKEGYEVEAAVDGKEGMAKIQTGQYSLILLDMNMPNLSGLDVLDQLSNDQNTTATAPIILLTNSADDEKVKAGLEKGAKSFLIKADMTPDQLLENIKKILAS